LAIKILQTKIPNTDHPGSVSSYHKDSHHKHESVEVQISSHFLILFRFPVVTLVPDLDKGHLTSLPCRFSCDRSIVTSKASYQQKAVCCFLFSFTSSSNCLRFLPLPLHPCIFLLSFHKLRRLSGSPCASCDQPSYSSFCFIICIILQSSLIATDIWKHSYKDVR